MKSKGRFLVKRFIDDSVGASLFKILAFREKKSFPENIKVILIYKLSAIGDSILTLPMIKKLRGSTGAKIIIACSNDNKIVFEGQKFVDEIVLLDVAGKNPLKFLGALKNIKKKMADVAIDLSHTGNLSAVFAYFTSRYNVGFFNPEIPRRKGFYDFEIEMDLKTHMINNYLKVLSFFRINPSSSVKLIPLVVENTKKSEFLKGRGKFVGVHPCHELEGKSWDGKKFAKVFDYLIKRGFVPVVFGSPKEKYKIEDVLKLVQYKDNIIDLSGKVSLKEVYELMKKLRFFIANDGGLMHMSAAAGIPTLGIFNVDIPTRYAPLNSRSIGVKGSISVKELIAILDKKLT